MYDKLYVFGDSWGFGSELDLPNEQPFGFWLSKSLGCQYENISQPAASLGLILKNIVYRLKEISSSNLAVIVIPPSVRWHDQSQEQGWFPLTRDDAKKYRDFMQDKTIEWFEYHQAMFIYTIQKILTDLKCEYIMAHNYEELPDFEKYSLQVDLDKFLSSDCLTTLLSGIRIDWKSKTPNDTAAPDYGFSGIYFEGNECHPNELGHKKIAELIFNKIKERQHL